MTKKEVFYLIGKCLTLDVRTEEEKQDIQNLIKSNEIPWPIFVKIASDHLVLPTIYVNFREHKMLEFLPVELNQHLQYIYNLNVDRNRKILFQIEELNALLSEADICPIYLKGAGNLLDNLYPDIGSRIMGDIDFLVHENEFLKAVDVLVNNGYYNKLKFIPEFHFRYKHFPRLAKKGMSAEVEVHRCLIKPTYKHFDYLFIKDKIKSVSGKYSCYVLSDMDNSLMNLFHAYVAMDLPENKSFRHLYDFFLLSRKIKVLEAYKEFGHYFSKAKRYYYWSNKMLSLNKDLPKIPVSIYFLQANYFALMQSKIYFKIYYSLYFVKNRSLHFIRVFFSEYGLLATKLYLKRNYPFMK